MPKVIIHGGFENIRFGDIFLEATVQKARNLMKAKHVLFIEEEQKKKGAATIRAKCRPQHKPGAYDVTIQVGVSKLVFLILSYDSF